MPRRTRTALGKQGAAVTRREQTGGTTAWSGHLIGLPYLAGRSTSGLLQPAGQRPLATIREALPGCVTPVL